MNSKRSNVVSISGDQNAETSSFDKFWDVYPRKKGKITTRHLWDQITSEKGYETRTLLRDSGTYLAITLQASPEDLILAAERYRESMRSDGGYGFKDGGKYILYPSTFLNSGRFEDYL